MHHMHQWQRRWKLMQRWLVAKHAVQVWGYWSRVGVSYIGRIYCLPCIMQLHLYIEHIYTHTHTFTPKPVNFGKVDGGDGSWRRLVLPRQCCVGVTSLVPTHVIGSAYPVHKRNELSPSKWFSLALPLFSLSSPFVFHPRSSNKKTGN